MRRIAVLFCVAWFAFHVAAQTSISFDHFFTDRTLRIDFFHSGTKGQESFSLDEAIEEGEWPGSRTNLIDTLNLGEYLARVYDLHTNALIFSRGYSTIFNEWQTTDEAARGVTRTFSETIRLPYPKSSIQLTIARRDKRMEFHELWSCTLDPSDPTQVNRAPARYPFTSSALMENGRPQQKVDIVIIGDGYTASDMKKFRADAKRFNDAMFSTEPFKSRKQDFNVWLVEATSNETGIDIPDKNLWKRNVLGCRYSTFGLPRYVLTTENKTLRNIAGAVPYDFICILVNDSRYGGGGIYNLYTTTYTNEQVKGQEWQMDYVYVHEFGHSFGGLGDEYYGSTVAYTDFYAPGVEPWEPNITALLDKRNVKWKQFIEEATPLPTPWEKAQFDSLEAERAKLDRLAPDYYEKREPILRAQTALLRNTKYANRVGAFEGAGYAAKGLYRPAVDCRMFTLSLNDFDPVCSAAIRRVIDFYTK